MLCFHHIGEQLKLFENVKLDLKEKEIMLCHQQEAW